LLGSYIPLRAIFLRLDTPFKGLSIGQRVDANRIPLAALNTLLAVKLQASLTTT